MKKRIISLFVSIAMVLSTIVCMTNAPVNADTLTTNQQNIVDRANYLWNTTWVCKKTVLGWNNAYTFSQGSTYHIPYGQPIYSGKYVGFGVSVDDFLAATKDPNSVFYNSRSVCEKESTYYATDCSAFVSWCWGATRHTTYGIPEIATYKGSPNESNCANVLQVGDCLNSNSHVVLVTAITRNASGVATQIEITEQTPPQIKRSYYTPATLAAKYLSSYSIYRYNSNVPAAPEGSGSNPDDHTPPTTTIQYDGTTMPTGDGVVWVQCVLNKLGYTCDIDGVFGPGSAAKVKEFQSANGLTANGIVDSATLAKLKEKWDEKKGESAPKTFTVTFDSNGGTCSTTSKTVTVGAKYGTLPAPTKAGYTFDGWYTTKTGTNKITADAVVNLTANTTIYAHWTEGSAPSRTLPFKGMDLSQWNETCNFATAKSKGIDFVILRCIKKKEGTTTNEKVVDPTFEKFYADAKANGIGVGAYVYMYATTEAAAKTEAQATINALKGKSLEFPLYLDAEDQTILALGKSTLTKLMLVELKMFEEAGFKVGIYSSQAFFNEYMDYSQLGGYDVWSAKWVATSGAIRFEDVAPDSTKKPSGAQMWQFSENGDGKYYGVGSSFLDINYCYYDYFQGTGGGLTITDNPDDHTPPTSLIKYDGTTMPSGDGVVWVQCVLNKLGYKCTIDGMYGPSSVTQVKAFQTDNGLEVDGEVGSETVAKLKEKWDAKKAELAPKSFTVTFNANGGTCSTASKTYTVGTKYGTLPTPTREGYTFDGWYTTKTGTNEVTADRVVEITSDGAFYAKWTKIPSSSAMTISVPQMTAHVGKTIEVPITVSDNPGIAIIGFKVEYNTSVMTLKSIKNGDMFTECDGNVSATPFVFNAYTGKENVTKNGTLVTLVFEIKADAVDGNYDIKVSECEAFNIDEKEVSVKAVNGSINVTSIAYGDVNSDGKVDRSDLLRLAKYFSGHDVEINMIAADVNCDGKVDRSDLLRLAKYFSGHDVILGE